MASVILAHIPIVPPMQDIQGEEGLSKVKQGSYWKPSWRGSRLLSKTLGTQPKASTRLPYSQSS